MKIVSDVVALPRVVLPVTVRSVPENPPPPPQFMQDVPIWREPKISRLFSIVEVPVPPM